jgi:hypothetical protein
MARSDVLVVPDLPAAIVAFRSWRWDAPWLRGVRGGYWPRGEPLEATCEVCESRRWRRHHGPPLLPSPTGEGHDSYGCGIYAFKSLADTLAPRGTTTILGEVHLWGRVYEHEVGWRAQFAQVKCLIDPGEDAGSPTMVAAAAETYGVPVVQPADLSTSLLGSLDG